jgi:hypothetical protein
MAWNICPWPFYHTLWLWHIRHVKHWVYIVIRPGSLFSGDETSQRLVDAFQYLRLIPALLINPTGSRVFRIQALQFTDSEPQEWVKTCYKPHKTCETWCFAHISQLVPSGNQTWLKISHLWMIFPLKLPFSSGVVTSSQGHHGGR